MTQANEFALLRIVALDLSLSCSGVAISNGHGDLVPSTIVPPKGMDGIDRLKWIRQRVLDLTLDAELVVLEGYAFAAHASHAHELGELGGVVRVALSDAGMPFVDVNPSSLKLYAAGKGNAKKEEVLAAAIRRLEYTGHSTDEADALWLCDMAMAHYAGGGNNDAERRALSKVPWPVFERVSSVLSPSNAT